MTPKFKPVGLVSMQAHEPTEVLLKCEPHPDYFEIEPDLPVGLTLRRLVGIISGMPVQAGVHRHTVRARWRATPKNPKRGDLAASTTLHFVVSGPTEKIEAAASPEETDFFDFDTPCPIPGGEQLRLLYKADVTKLGAGCSGCALGALKRKYINAYRNLLTSGS
jgi:hypothetical protein